MQKKPVAWMKIYSPSGNYVAACNDAAAAASLMAFYGDGAEIRNGHAKRNVVWREGSESQRAAESYDFVETVIRNRVEPITLNTFDAEQARRVDSGLEQARATVRAMLSRKAR
jgi:hypothetical protein